jgi:hypothetical protein
MLQLTVQSTNATVLPPTVSCHSLIPYISTYRPYLKTVHPILYQSKALPWMMLTWRSITVADIYHVFDFVIRCCNEGLWAHFLLHVWWTSCRMSGLVTFWLYIVFIVYWRVSYNFHNKWQFFSTALISSFLVRLHSNEKRLLFTSHPPVHIIPQAQPILFIFIWSPKYAYIFHPRVCLQPTLHTREQVKVESVVYYKSLASSVSDTTLITPRNHRRAERNSALYYSSPQSVCPLLWAFIGAW